MRRNKYNAQKTTVDGIRFDSKMEANRYGELKLLEKAGSIVNLEIHPTYPIVVNGIRICTYRGDFRYGEVDTGETIHEDTKGVRTPVFILKKKLVAALHGIVIREVYARPKRRPRKKE